MEIQATQPVIALRPPYDFARSIRFWQRSTGELCEQWADGVYRRIIVFNDKPSVLTLHSIGTVDLPVVHVALDGIPAATTELATLDPLVRGLLGDHVDLRAFYAGVSEDPTLALVTQQLYGVRAPCSPLWETLCWVICGQQISVPFAFLLKQRLVQRYGDAYDVAGRLLYRFPPPDRLAAADVEDLLPMQFSRNKASFLIGLARQIVDGELNLEGVRELPTSEAVEYLVGFRGIGRWTAEFTLMRGLCRVDALPAADAGVRQGIAALYGQRLLEPDLRAFAQRWGEWGGLAAMYVLLWLREQS